MSLHIWLRWRSLEFLQNAIHHMTNTIKEIFKCKSDHDIFRIMHELNYSLVIPIIDLFHVHIRPWIDLDYVYCHVIWLKRITLQISTTKLLQN